MVFSFQDFPASITLQPLSDMMLLAKVYLNTSLSEHKFLSCFTQHSMAYPPNYQHINLIFTAPYASLGWASKPIPSLYLVPPPRFHFFRSHPISHTMSQLTTRATYISSIYGVRMPPQHSKPARIHNNTISKFILRHHYDKETSTFRWDS